MKAKVNKVNIQLTQEDILSLPVAAIVTVTDPNLHVDPALLAKTGPTVQVQAEAIRWSDVGTAIVTDAGLLKNTVKIIHAVGPRWGDDSARAKLALVTWQCLELAEEHGLKSVALPPISTGALGYPLENCALTMLEQIIDFTFEKLRFLRSIVLCVGDAPNAMSIFETEFTRLLEELRETGEGQVHV
jgi:O-acetyl-ADP-ribose deacetylase (regulator of RNase III)